MTMEVDTSDASTNSGVPRHVGNTRISEKGMKQSLLQAFREMALPASYFGLLASRITRQYNKTFFKSHPLSGILLWNTYEMNILPEGPFGHSFFHK